MNTSPSIGAIAKALASAQGEVKGAVRDSTNPFFKAKYSDLSSVKDACQEALTKYGIAVIQSPSSEGAKVSITTLLCHESGEWISGVITAIAKDESAQSVGSVITYLRRYALAAMVGVAPEDDDGESAQHRPAQKYPVKGVEAAKEMLTTHAHALDDRRKALWNRLLALAMPPGAAAEWVRTNRISRGGDLTVADFEKLEGLVAAIEKDAEDKTDIAF